MCIATYPTPSSAATDPSDAETSLIIVAPASTAALRHRFVSGVDRHPAERADRPDDREDPLEFFVDPDRCGTRAGRLSADVDDVGTVVDHRMGVGDRRFEVANRPPSEKESGVTLRMPMTRGRIGFTLGEAGQRRVG